MTCWAMVWATLTLAAALSAGGTLGQPVRDDPNVAPAGHEIEGQSANTTAEDVLEALQKKRPVNPVIEPASVLALKGVPIKQPLWPEGAYWVQRSGRLARDGRWWTFVPDDEPQAGPIKLLPNATLEAMVRSNKGLARPLRFAVSGELTVFQDENYLLPRFATRATDQRPKAVSGQDHDRGVSRQGGVNSGATEEGEAMATDAPVDEVLARLRERRPSEELISAAAPPRPARVDRVATVGWTMMPDGSPLVERPGRIIADGAWWTFVFESDHPEHPEPPMKLLPNQNVELMVEASTRGQAGLVFIVSGEVTVFYGENHLLPRAARLRIDSGNLRK